jgi:hypothetical protein
MRAVQPVKNLIVSKRQATSRFQGLAMICGNFVGLSDPRNSAVPVGPARPIVESLVVAGHAGLHDRSPFRS